MQARSRLPGHRTLPVLLQQTRTLLHLQPPSRPRPVLLCCQAISSHHLQPKETDKPSACPTLCSWRAGSCSPGSPELPLMQLQAPPHCSAGITGAEAGSTPPSAPVPFQYCPQTPEHFSPQLRQVVCPACASARTEQVAMGRRCLLLYQLWLCMADTTSHAKRCQGGRTGVQAARALLSS